MDNKKKFDELRNKIKRLALATTITGVSFVGVQASPNKSAPTSTKVTVKSNTHEDNSSSMNFYDAIGSDSIKSNSNYAEKLGKKIKALSNDEQKNDSPRASYNHKGVSLTETNDGILTFSYEKKMQGIKLDVIYNPNAIIADDVFAIYQDGQKINDPTYLTPIMIKGVLDEVQRHGNINKDYLKLVTEQKYNENIITSLVKTLENRHEDMVKEDGGIDYFGVCELNEKGSSSSEYVELLDSNNKLYIKYGNDNNKENIVFDKDNRDFYTSLGGDKITNSEVRTHLKNLIGILEKVEGCKFNIEPNQTAKTIRQIKQNQND